MVIERTHRAEDGTLIVLSAETDEELDRWDLEALTMAEDPKFRHKVEDDCKFLENAIRKANESITDWMIAEDFLNFSDIYEEVRPHPYYDFRYPSSPSRVRALKQQLWWMLDLLRNWYKLLESRVEKPRKQVKKLEKQTKRELTISHEIHRLESLRPDRRAEYLENKPELVEPWLIHLLEKKRSEEARAKQQEKERNIRRYRQTARLEAEKLSEAKDAQEDLREALKKWVQEKQTK